MNTPVAKMQVGTSGTAPCTSCDGRIVEGEAYAEVTMPGLNFHLCAFCTRELRYGLAAFLSERLAHEGVTT